MNFKNKNQFPHSPSWSFCSTLFIFSVSSFIAGCSLLDQSAQKNAHSLQAHKTHHSSSVSVKNSRALLQKNYADVDLISNTSVAAEGSSSLGEGPTEEQMEKVLDNVGENVIVSELFAIPKDAEEFIEGTSLGDEEGKASEENAVGTAEVADKSAGENQADTQVKVQFNRQVQDWIDYFTGKGRDQIYRYLTNGKKYQRLIQDILVENDLPKELYYLPLIESGFSTHAHSSANALGIWQFIKGTGKRYGLRCDAQIDERRDPIRATEAAARYLRDLYTAFQSWHLALAAYNAGEHRILSAILKGRSRNYWDLVRNNLLPKETAQYVPKFLAAVVVSENLDLYGLDPVQFEEYPDVELVEIPSPARLKDVANKIEVPLAKLQDLNPNIRKGVTPYNESSYEIWVPAEKVSLAKSLNPVLAQMRLSSAQAHKEAGSISDELEVAPKTPRITTGYYKVRNGDTLKNIARRHHVTIGYLKRLNGLSGQRIYAGQQLRIRTKSYHPHVEHENVGQYVVRRGDTLSGIARKFSISISSLRKHNNLRNSRLSIGQRLAIPGQDKSS